MKKKNCAIVFGITQDYVFALANVLIGIKEKCTKFYDDIIVYHDGINNEDKENLNKILPCNFIFYKKIDELNLNDEALIKYSKMAFSRFECFNLLQKYKYIIWHDVDILVQKDFSDLLSYSNVSGFAATKSDSGAMIESNFYQLIPKYNMFSILYNTGVLVFSDRLINYKSYSNWCYKTVKKYTKKLRYLDQGVINLLIQKFNIQVEEIDILKYCCHPSREKVDNAVIVHAYGNNKFWNSEILKKQFPQWSLNNKTWLKIVGQEEKTKKENGPLVSILISVYKRYDYLDEAIKSIINQTYENIEIIIIVEQSDISEVIQRKIKNYKDSRIVIIQNSKKLGFAESLNIGIETAKGKYIARMDDDDISKLDRIEKQVNFMENNKEIAIVGTFMQMFMNSNELCTLPTDNETLKILTIQSTPLFHPTVMMRKCDIDKYKLRYNKNFFTEDYELWSIAIEFLKIANIPEVLLMYRASNQNATSLNEEKIHESHKKVIKNQMKKYLHLDLNDNELELLQSRRNVFSNIFNLREALDFRQKTLNKIIEANKKYNFYNQKILEKKFKQKYKIIKFFISKNKVFLCNIYRIVRFCLKFKYGEEKVKNVYDIKFKKFLEKL